MKVDFSKVENILSDTLRKIFIDRLSELAIIANLIQTSSQSYDPKLMDEVAASFQKELSKLKRKDKKIYDKLGLSDADEERFKLSPSQFSQEDWILLKELKMRIDDLKRQLQGDDLPNLEHEQQVEHERKRHVYKRFNIRDGWIPLH
ncbi:MAG: hypothetical protein H0V82_11220 [Candidatus Protochlamydia sp.]|nr:hypothetical protein [Candidatus Protochlamydia sp.]